MALVPVGIALGSNMGNRSAELDAGFSFLRSLAHRIRQSPRFETIPVDCPPDSAPFLNAVVEMEIDTVDLPPLHLLAALQHFELMRGRPPLRETNASRPIDLDIIYYGVERFDAMGLIIPHPRAHERCFVLEPLATLRPNLVLPGQTKTVMKLLTDLRS